MLLFSADESMFDKLKIKNEFIRFYPQGFVHYELLKEIIQKNNWENTVFYDYTNAVNCQYISSLRIFANRLIILITIFVFTAMFLSLCGIIHEHIEKSSKYYGMLSAIGMKKSSELAIFYVEYSIILFFSIMLAVPIGIIMFCMTNLILSNTIGGSINVSIKSILALYIGIVLFLLIMIIIITTVNIIKKFSDTIVIQLKSL